MSTVTETMLRTLGVIIIQFRHSPSYQAPLKFTETRGLTHTYKKKSIYNVSNETHV